ncbi:hypothetical protein J3Q64DRAFT_1736087 [Phycomyces blakesleeanus]|uniref:Uncharacterized protein n=1 Tax=Phycomyces blakesleeanus TaxID=4837 RepID=A0ABR3B210_PHYBL
MFSIAGKVMFEDGQGNLYNEAGQEAMDWEEVTDSYNLQNLTNLTKYKEKRPVELGQNDPELDSQMEEIQYKLSQGNTLRH